MNNPTNPAPIPPFPVRKVRGFLEPRKVRAAAFYTITLCILVSVVASILAIWDFAPKDVFWRTVATCVVIAGAAGIFSVVNAVFGSDQQ